MDDTNWCLFCNHYFEPDQTNTAYCSPTCRDNDISRSKHIKTCCLTIFDMPAISLSGPQLPAKDRQLCSKKKEYRSAQRFCSPAYLHDEELQDVKTGIQQTTTEPTCVNREAILRWARAVSPGLEEEAPFSSTPGHIPSTSALANELKNKDRLSSARPTSHFPLTAQNLAPPCVTVISRHISLLHHSSHYENRTAPSLLSQDDGSVLTPTTTGSSGITPSVSSGGSPTSPSSAKPLLDRFVSRVRSWMLPPSRLHRHEEEMNQNTDDSSDTLVHSDETIRATHQMPACRNAFDLPRRSHICQSSHVNDFAGVSYDSDIM